MKKKLLSVVLIAALLICQLPGAFGLTAGAESAPLNYRSDFEWGINIHNKGYADYAVHSVDEIMGDAAGMHLDSVRINCSPSSESDFVYLDQVVASAAAHGLRVMLCLDGVVGINALYDITYAADGTTEVSRVVNSSKVYTYFSTLSRRYRGRIAYYNIGNEMDNRYIIPNTNIYEPTGYNAANAKPYIDIMNNATDAVHAGDPAAKTVINISWKHYGFLKLVNNNGGKWDITGLCWYSDMGNSTRLINDMVNVCYDLFGKQILICESNQRPTENMPEQTFTDYLTEICTGVYANEHVNGLFIYELYDETRWFGGTGENYNPEGHYGIYPKSSTYEALRVLFGGDSAESGLPENCLIIDETGKSTQWGNAASWIWDRSYQTVAQVDLSYVNNIEFDIWIEDYAALCSALSAAGLSLGALDLSLSNNNSQFANKYVASFGNQITASGWNHIVIPRSAFGTTGAGDLNWSAVTGWAIMFRNNGNAASILPIAGDTVRVENICATGGLIFPAPDCRADNAVMLTHEGTRTRWGDRFNYLNDRMHVWTLAPADFTDAENVEFDLYIEDYAALCSALAAAGLENAGIAFGIQSDPSDPWSGRQLADITDQITVSGWNRICVPKSAFMNVGTGVIDWSRVCGYQMCVLGQNGQVNSGDQYLWVANVRGTGAALEPGSFAGVTAPELTAPDRVLLDAAGARTVWGQTYAGIAERLYHIGLAPVDFSQASTVEFDLYIEDYAALCSALNAQGLTLDALRFALNSDPDYKSRERYSALIGDQVTGSGWNHISVAKDAFLFDNTGAIDWTQMTGWSVMLDGAGTESCSDAQEIWLCNVCAAGMAYVTIPEIEDPHYRMLDREGKSNSWGNAFSWVFDRVWGAGLLPVDCSAAEYIEFDLYIQNYENLVSALSAAGRSLSDIQLSLSNGTSRFTNKFCANIGDRITHSGWNHIRVAKSEFRTTGAGNLDWTRVTGWAILLAGNPGVPCACSTDVLWVANVRATSSAYRSAEVTENVVMLDETGVETTWGNAFSWIFDRLYHVSDRSCDFSGVRTIEFDLYIEDYAALTAALSAVGWTTADIGFNLSNGTTRYVNKYSASIGTQITGSGWNHIVLPRTSFYNTGAGVLDWTQVTGWSVVMTGNSARDSRSIADHQIRISNVCGKGGLTSGAPECTRTDCRMLDRAGKTATWGAKFNYLVDRFYNNGCTAVDLSAAETIEFDLYIEDYDLLCDALAAAGSSLDGIHVGLNSDAGNRFGARYGAGIGDQITDSGWNHISLAKSAFSYVGSGTLNWKRVCGWSFWANGSASTGDLSDQYIVAANIYGAAAAYRKPDAPAAKDYTAVGIGTGEKTAEFGDCTVSVCTETVPGGLLGVDYQRGFVEFDYYVSYLAAYRKAMTNDGITASVLTVSDVNGNRISADFSDQVTTEGWNHIVLELGSDFDGTSANLSSVNEVKIAFDAAPSAGVENVRISVANLISAEHIYGDLNRDGSVDIRDLVRMKKLNAGTATADMIAADADRSGTVDAADLVRTRAFLLGL